MPDIKFPETNEQDSQQEGEEAHGNAPAETENEFRMTIRKLELPVRPRGVLAE